jgi:hypothetical protein
MREIDPENSEAAIRKLIESIEELKQKSGNQFTQENFLAEVESIYSTKLKARPFLLKFSLRLFYFRYWFYGLYFQNKNFESRSALEASKQKYFRFKMASKYGSSLNQDSVDWLKNEMHRLNMCQFDAVFLVWAGVIQPSKRKIVFNHWDRYSFLFLMLPIFFLALFTASALFCNCVTTEGKYYFSMISLLEGYALGKLFKAQSYDVYQIAMKYYIPTGWRSSPIDRASIGC